MGNFFGFGASCLFPLRSTMSGSCSMLFHSVPLVLIRFLQPPYHTFSPLACTNALIFFSKDPNAGQSRQTYEHANLDGQIPDHIFNNIRTTITLHTQLVNIRLRVRLQSNSRGRGNPIHTRTWFSYCRRWYMYSYHNDSSALLHLTFLRLSQCRVEF